MRSWARRAKLDCTIKPSPETKSGKKKIRIVGCGNYAEGDPDTEPFASGTNAVSVRIAFSIAARRLWSGLSMRHQDGVFERNYGGSPARRRS